jgi:membrane-associated phospholipid phosphatase
MFSHPSTKKKMRNKYILLGIGVLVFIACNKDISERVVAEFEPTIVDNAGGTWKTVVLTNASEVTVAAPDAITSAAYQSELNTIIQSQTALSTIDKVAIKNWKNSGIIRWNEKARELVSKYNLPPEANSDGTYPAPSAANPGAYPNFPFSNPPYASRAYAYLSVAMYDALVSCWKYKFQFNRKSPAVNDARVKSLETIQSDLPSYPSEDAVVAQVSYRVLKVFFPLDSVALESMAKEQKRAKNISGVASASDIAAGEVIANYVADKVIARSKTDGMGTAGGNATLWAQLEAAAVTHGTTTIWKSLEHPARPPMLPFFGNVKLWNFSTLQRDSMRPPPPPAVGSPDFQKALDEIHGYAAHPTSETWRIAMYWADGAGSYTPPGHWNEIACNTFAKYNLNELRIARALSLMNMAIEDAGICCWDTKSYYYIPRPSQMTTDIKTIGLPNFPSYTSGHSTFSGAASTVLGYLFPSDKSSFDAMAQEASVSRMYGGIHYRFDCEVGLKCGKAIGGFAVQRGQADGSN